MLVLLGVLAVLLAVRRRPTRHDVATALDELGRRLETIDRSVGGARTRTDDLTRSIGESLDLAVVLGKTLAAARAVGQVDGGRASIRKLDGTMETAVDGLVPPDAPAVDGPPDGARYTAGRFVWDVAGDGIRSGLAVPFAGGSLAVFSRAAAAFDERASALLGAIAQGAEPAVRNALEHLRVLEEAATDPLTGLGSARAFAEALPRAVSACRRSGRPLCLIRIDLDDFKSINDRHPRHHDAGDDALSGFGATVRSTLRTSDEAFRNSGGADEFFLLLHETGLDEARLTYRRLARELEDARFGDENDVGPLTMSSGLATLRPTDTLEALVDRAKRLATVAKETGKNRLVAEDEI